MEPEDLYFDRSHPIVFCNNTVIYSVNNTMYMYQILILITNICAKFITLIRNICATFVILITSIYAKVLLLITNICCVID